MGLYGLTGGAAPVFTATVTGILVDIWSWRVIFIVLSVIMVFALLQAVRAAENVLDTEKKKFKVTSFVLSGLTFGGLILAIDDCGCGGRC